MLKADGFDAAIIGITLSQPMREEIIVYDYEECLKILMKEMTQEEAIEHMDFNVIGSYMGELTPLFMQKYTSEEVEEYAAEKHQTDLE